MSESEEEQQTKNIKEKPEIQYLKVVEEEGDEPIELPTEEDGTLLLTTLTAQFPGASGLKYRNPETNAARGVRLSLDGRFHAPPEGSWTDYEYYCVFPKENKRKNDDESEGRSKKAREGLKETTDLIILGLPYSSTEDELRKYFSKFGDIVILQIKRNLVTGNSRGYGFIRFTQMESQKKVTSTRHMIGGRWCDVRIPASREEGVQAQVPCKVFVGRVTPELTPEVLKEYFSKFGEVLDVFTPKPFRSFSFVTFLNPQVAEDLCGEDHIINGVSVHVSEAAKKKPKQNDQPNPWGGRSSQHNNSSGGINPWSQGPPDGGYGFPGYPDGGYQESGYNMNRYDYPTGGWGGPNFGGAGRGFGNNFGPRSSGGFRRPW